MSESTPLELVLEIRWMNFTDGASTWWKDDGRLNTLLLPIQDKVFLDVPVELEMKRERKRVQSARLQDVAPELASTTGGTYRIVGSEAARTSRLALFFDEGSFALELGLLLGPDDHQPTLNELTRMSVELNNIGLQHGTVGPIFLLRWLEPDYPRPFPPRFAPLWPPGALAYYLSAAYYSTQEPDKQATFALLRDTPLQPGLVRRQDNDLLIIQAAEKLEPREELERQLYKMELWVGKTLNLDFDRDYQANGDKRFGIWSKEIVKPFSFYDASTRTGYKVVAENRDDELDAETWEELEELLPLRALPDGRPVVATRVILVGREAALQHLPRIRELGGSGVLYLGQDGQMWDPSPSGQWIPTNWDEV